MKERFGLALRSWLTVLSSSFRLGSYPPREPCGPKDKMVAAENFYGNIAEQIGGDRVEVTSILSDPNVDPHEYESNVDDAKAIAESGSRHRERRRLRRLDG